MFSNLFNNPALTFGLDIGYDSLKVVQLKKTAGGICLKGFNSIPLPFNSFTKDGITNPEQITRALKQAMDEAEPQSIKSKYAITSLQESIVFSKIVNFPKVKQSDLENSIRYEIGEIFPVPVEELYYDWQLINEHAQGNMKAPDITKQPDVEKQEEKEKDKKSENNKDQKEPNPTNEEEMEPQLEILVAGTPKNIVDQYQKILNECGITISALETKSISSARATLDPFEKKGILIVDIGAESTNLSIFDEGIIRFTGTVKCGGNVTTRALSGLATLPEDSKEKHTLIQNIDTNLNNEFAKKKDLIIKSLLPITQEINQAIKFYQNRVGKVDKLNRITITGGGANIPHIADIIEEHTGFTCGIANPFTNIKQPKDQSLTAFSPYTVAIGCALRSFMEN
ncbi:MAG: pilus assembly protein PilM [bacterium]|nr:pilus assembly protein PilM [bacterium]